MKKIMYLVLCLTICMASCAKNAPVQDNPQADTTAKATVYFTSDISAEGLVKIYKALGVPAHGRVAVKISTGESSQSNHLRPELIGDLVRLVGGNLVECNTAYGGIDSLSCVWLQVDGAHVPSVPVGSPAENSVGEERIGIVAVSRDEDVDISHKAKPQGQMVGSIASRHMYR